MSDSASSPTFTWPGRRSAAMNGHRRRYYVLAAWLFWLVVAVNAGIIVWIWTQGGNVSGVHSTGLLLDSIGRITGLLSAYSALIQVLLLARIPMIERATGFDRLTRWHRLNGKVCLYLVLAHVVFITIGYALLDRISVPSEAVTLITSYPGMLAATVGTGLFIVVVVSSFVIVRRTLPYESWYAVHFTVYAAIALAWFHQIPTGNEFVLNTVAATYWESLYVATLALLVVFRVMHPAWQMWRYRLRVVDVQNEGPGVVSLLIRGRDLDRLNAQPGQFFLWRFLTWNRWWEVHPFSLSAAPQSRGFRITAKNLGNFTRKIGEIPPGTLVMVEGPFGVFTEDVRRCRNSVLIAGGIGITPIRALAEVARGDVVLIYRALREEDLIFRTELERLAEKRGIHLHFVVGDHAAPGGERLLSPEHLRDLVPDIAQRDVFACGPPAMADFIEANVRRAGVPARFIHVERFAL